MNAVTMDETRGRVRDMTVVIAATMAGVIGVEGVEEGDEDAVGTMVVMVHINQSILDGPAGPTVIAGEVGHLVQSKVDGEILGNEFSSRLIIITVLYY
jgi:hypothetical protein